MGVRGIYLSNFIHWDEHEQALFVHDQYGFEPTRSPRDRTFNRYAKLDDIHANGVHDYLKYLKFGYGRATDDASTLIRSGLMTREEGVGMVREYDHRRPSDLDLWLNFVDMPETEFMHLVDSQRDPAIWRRRQMDLGEHLTGSETMLTARRQQTCACHKEPTKIGSFPKVVYDLTDARWLTEYDEYKLL